MTFCADCLIKEFGIELSEEEFEFLTPSENCENCLDKPGVAPSEQP